MAALQSCIVRFFVLSCPRMLYTGKMDSVKLAQIACKGWHRLEKTFACCIDVLICWLCIMPGLARANPPAAEVESVVPGCYQRTLGLSPSTGEDEVR